MVDAPAEFHKHQAPVATSGISGVVDIESEIAVLSGLDLHALQVRWRKLLRTNPPAHLSRSLLLRILAYRIQARMYGGLDRETGRTLGRIAKESARRRARGEGRGSKTPLPVPPVPANRELKPGTLLLREHNGKVYAVTVVLNGFAWDGRTYKSLSEIARVITGTQWSGPRFFGLRDRTAPPRGGQEEMSA